MPKELRKTARREWGRITKDLLELGVLTIVDGKALAMYCDAYADWEQMQRVCVKEGMIIEEPIVSKDGMIVGVKKKLHPALTAKQLSMKLMKSFLVEYGLTPASRTKLKIEARKPEGDLPSREDTRPPADDEPNLDDIDLTVQ